MNNSSIRIINLNCYLIENLFQNLLNNLFFYIFLYFITSLQIR